MKKLMIAVALITMFSNANKAEAKEIDIGNLLKYCNIEFEETVCELFNQSELHEGCDFRKSLNHPVNSICKTFVEMDVLDYFIAEKMANAAAKHLVKKYPKEALIYANWKTFGGCLPDLMSMRQGKSEIPKPDEKAREKAAEIIWKHYQDKSAWNQKIKTSIFQDLYEAFPCE